MHSRVKRSQSVSVSLRYNDCYSQPPTISALADAAGPEPHKHVVGPNWRAAADPCQQIALLYLMWNRFRAVAPHIPGPSPAVEQQPAHL